MKYRQMAVSNEVFMASKSTDNTGQYIHQIISEQPLGTLAWRSTDVLTPIPRARISVFTHCLCKI